MLTMIVLALLVLFVLIRWLTWNSTKRAALTSESIDREFMTELNEGDPS
ncbi:hypothetical protein NBRC13296_04085 [Paenibacillus chitinolyticus]